MYVSYSRKKETRALLNFPSASSFHSLNEFLFKEGKGTKFLARSEIEKTGGGVSEADVDFVWA